MATIDTWLEKYKPNQASDLITNMNAVKEVRAWLTNYDKTKVLAMTTVIKKKPKGKATGARTTKTNQKKSDKTGFKSCLIVTGNHGVGKSVTIDIILKELNYDILNLDINI